MTYFSCSDARCGIVSGSLRWLTSVLRRCSVRNCFRELDDDVFCLSTMLSCGIVSGSWRWLILWCNYALFGRDETRTDFQKLNSKNGFRGLESCTKASMMWWWWVRLNAGVIHGCGFHALIRSKARLDSVANQNFKFRMGSWAPNYRFEEVHRHQLVDLDAMGLKNCYLTWDKSLVKHDCSKS